MCGVGDELRKRPVIGIECLTQTGSGICMRGPETDPLVWILCLGRSAGRDFCVLPGFGGTYLFALQWAMRRPAPQHGLGSVQMQGIYGVCPETAACPQVLT